jgi:pyruvate-ferredoxin/flavodoxin oxidoreductase
MHEEKKAVDAGYWHLYRHDPRLKELGKNPFQLDSKAPSQPYQDFLNGELRYSQLKSSSPEKAAILFEQAQQHARLRYETYQSLSKS